MTGPDTSTITSTTPYWRASASLPEFPAVTRGEHVDVVVVGGGITGLTAAYLLTSAGKRVAVLERDRCAQVDTGHTSAHLTMVTDTRLTPLAERFGRSHAQAVWDAGLAAIALIDDTVRAHAIDCAFARVEGYLHEGRSEGAPGEDALREDAALAAELGFDAEFVSDVPLVGGPGVRFDHQARFHPHAYLGALTRAIVERGGRIYEHSEVEEYGADVLSVTARGHRITCDDIVMATHSPQVGVAGMVNATLQQTKLALYTSYVVAGRVPKGTLPDALWWDTSDPYQYLRVEPHHDHDLVIFGGEDHKTGQVNDTTACHARLEDALRARLPDVDVTHRWSGQVIETPDGLPLIGRMAENQYAATGFAGNGMTLGTLGAMIVTDEILGRTNPWAELFAFERPAVRRGLRDYIKENADYPYYLVRSRFAGAEGRSLRAVRRGEGAIVEHEGSKVAVYRDEDGALSVRSAVCPHMGCAVAWNPAERTWDCPCHGSRFTTDGAVISGPAESPLADV